MADVERENQQLRQQLQTLGTSLAPDYEASRDRTLSKLKMGRQSPAGKAIQAFIRELQKPVTGNLHPKGEELNEVTQIQPPDTWEARADDFLKEVAGNG